MYMYMYMCKLYDITKQYFTTKQEAARSNHHHGYHGGGCCNPLDCKSESRKMIISHEIGFTARHASLGELGFVQQQQQRWEIMGKLKIHF